MNLKLFEALVNSLLCSSSAGAQKSCLPFSRSSELENGFEGVLVQAFLTFKLILVMHQK